MVIAAALLRYVPSSGVGRGCGQLVRASMPTFFPPPPPAAHLKLLLPPSCPHVIPAAWAEPITVGVYSKIRQIVLITANPKPLARVLLLLGTNHSNVVARVPKRYFWATCVHSTGNSMPLTPLSRLPKCWFFSFFLRFITTFRAMFLLLFC